MSLTRRQKEIYDFIEEYLDVNGFSPSIEEIRDHIGLSAVSTVHKHLLNLESRGFIERISNTSRSIVLTSRESEIENSLPMLGVIAAGRPIEALEIGDERVLVPEDLCRGKGSYVLKVRGSSMIDECIRDGDFVVVEQRSSPHTGETVVALINNEEATLKKFYRENDTVIRLQPANIEMEPIFVRDEDLTVQGVVIGVIRKY